MYVKAEFSSMVLKFLTLSHELFNFVRPIERSKHVNVKTWVFNAQVVHFQLLICLGFKFLLKFNQIYNLISFSMLQSTSFIFYFQKFYYFERGHKTRQAVCVNYVSSRGM